MVFGRVVSQINIIFDFHHKAVSGLSTQRQGSDAAILNYSLRNQTWHSNWAGKCMYE